MLDYDTLQIMEVNFLLPCFDGNQMFVLPPVGVSSYHTKAKSMDGMDKRYDGHVWTKTQTTNISNELRLFFACPLALATSSAKILNATTSNVFIVHVQSKILKSVASPRNPFPLVVSCLPSPLLCAISATNLPSALYHALPKSSTSTSMILLSRRVFILAIIITLSRSAIVGLVINASTPSLRNTSREHPKPLTAKSF